MKKLKLFSRLSVLFFGIACFSIIGSGAASAFEDVGENHIYFDSIDYLETNGFAEGYDDGTFLPDVKINRAEFLKIVLENKSYFVSDSKDCFKDVTDQWFAPYICYAYENGYVNGYEDGTFLPAQNISFAEAAKIIIEVNAYNGFNAEPSDNWYDPYIVLMSESEAIPLTIKSFDHEITRGEMAKIIQKKTSYYSTSNQRSLEQEDLTGLSLISSEEDKLVYVLKNVYGHSVTRSSVLNSIDYDSFRMIDLGSSHCEMDGCVLTTPEMYMDDDNVYYLPPASVGSDLRILTGADTSTFKTYNRYALDENHLYRSLDGEYESVLDFDQSLRVIEDHLFAGEDYVYFLDTGIWELDLVEGIDVNTFVKFDEDLDLGLYRDKDALYAYNSYSLSKFTNLDPDDFEVLLPNPEQYSDYYFVFRDEARVYHAEGSMATFAVLEEADPDTFEIIETTDYTASYYGYIPGLFAKDKDSLFKINEREEVFVNSDIDVESFELVPTIDSEDNTPDDRFYYLKDDSGVYNVEDLSKFSSGDSEDFTVTSVKIGFPTDYSYFIYGAVGDSFWYDYPSAFDHSTKSEIVTEDIDPDSFEVVTSKTFYTDGDWVGDGFLAKDDSGVWLFDDISQELTKLEGVDAASFEATPNGITFKDKDHVYEFEGVDPVVMEDADPATFEIILFEGAAYTYDKSHVWKIDNDLEMTLLPDADVDTFFDRGLSDDTNHIIVTDLESYDSEGVLLNLEDSTLSLLTEDMTEEGLLDTDANLLLKASYYEQLWCINCLIALPELEWVDEFNIDNLDFVNKSLPEEYFESGMPFFIKTEDKTYMLRVAQFYRNTNEVVLEYVEVE